MTNILDGKGLAAKLREEIRDEVKLITANGGRPPHLVAIQVGTDGASTTYVNSKEKDCDFVGFTSTVHRLDESTSENQLLDLIQSINSDSGIDGLIVQLPLPGHIDAEKITDAISPSIDVDGFHTISVGKLAKGQDTYVSATPFGIMMLLEKYQIENSFIN